MLSKPIYLNKIEDSGISCVEIKFIDIRRNTKSEANAINYRFDVIDLLTTRLPLYHA
jgi:hypothetical protein